PHTQHSGAEPLGELPGAVQHTRVLARFYTDHDGILLRVPDPGVIAGDGHAGLEPDWREVILRTLMSRDEAHIDGTVRLPGPLIQDGELTHLKPPLVRGRCLR